MTKLSQALAGVTKLGFDTSPVIYFIEVNAQYDALVTEILINSSFDYHSLASVRPF